MQQDGSRQILDTHIGKKNIVPKDELLGTMINTYKELVTILADHCGPYGKFAMITEAHRPDVAPVFTKDGINIVRAIDYFNPMEQIVRNELAYVGSRVERSTGDGTTSAMIMTGVALVSLLEQLQQDKIQRSYIELCKDYDEFVKWIEAGLNNLKFTYSRIAAFYGVPESRVIHDIAKFQAMTSSHGDDKLSDAVARVFSTMPKDAWEYVTFQQDNYETEERIKCVVEDDQYTIQCAPLVPSMLNHNSGTEFSLNSCSLIVVNQPLSSVDLVSQEVLRLLQENSLNNKRTVILCPNGIDQNTSMALIHESKKPGAGYAVFTCPVKETQYNDIFGLQAVAGIPQTDTTASVRCLENIRLYYSQGYMKINGLYENTGSVVHPQALDASSELSALLNTLHQAMDQLKKCDVTPQTSKDLQKLQLLYNKIKFSKHYVVKIGGAAHDNAHAVDVVTDTLLAVKNSLTEGFLPAANMALLHLCSQTEEANAPWNIRVFMTAFYKAASAVIDFIKGNKDNTIPEILKTVFDRKEAQPELALQHRALLGYLNIFDDQHINFFEFEVGEIFKCGNKRTLYIQPASTELNIVKRFGEVALKYLNTARIVAPGCVYTGAKNEATLASKV